MAELCFVTIECVTRESLGHYILFIEIINQSGRFQLLPSICQKIKKIAAIS